MNKIEQLLLQSALKVANLENTETKKRKLGDGDAPSILDDKHGAKKKKKAFSVYSWLKAGTKVDT